MIYWDWRHCLIGWRKGRYHLYIYPFPFVVISVYRGVKVERVKGLRKI
jgi:hypothetical protein